MSFYYIFVRTRLSKYVATNLPVNQSYFSVLRLKVTRPSYFVAVPSYFKALWYPHLYFDRKSNT